MSEFETEEFERYSRELKAEGISAIPREELVELQKRMVDGDKEAHDILWKYGLKLVLKIVNAMRREGRLSVEYDDAVAAGNMAIGEAILRWVPSKGAFSTWVWIYIRGAVLAANRKEIRRGLTGGDIEGLPLVVSGFQDPEFGYDDWNDGIWDLYEEHQTPEFTDEYVEITRVIALLPLLPDREARYIQAVYFEEISQEDLALAEGVSTRMVRKVLTRATERLSELYQDRSFEGSGSEQD